MRISSGAMLIWNQLYSSHTSLSFSPSNSPSLFLIQALHVLLFLPRKLFTKLMHRWRERSLLLQVSPHMLAPPNPFFSFVISFIGIIVYNYFLLLIVSHSPTRMKAETLPILLTFIFTENRTLSGMWYKPNKWMNEISEKVVKKKVGNTISRSLVDQKKCQWISLITMENSTMISNRNFKSPY